MRTTIKPPGTKTRARPSKPTETATGIDPAGLIDLDAMAEAAECLRTLAHPHRLRMIEALLHTPTAVGELAELCGISPHATSEHLRLMKDRGLLRSTRDGRRVIYEIAEPGLAGILACIRSRFASNT